MQRKMSRMMLLLTMTAVVLSGCYFDITGFVVFCDKAELFFDIDEGYPDTYSLQIFRSSDDEAISGAYDVSGDGAITIPYDEPLEEGTELYLAVDGEKYESQTVECSHEGTRTTTWFEPGDDRINRQAYAYASVYCQDDNQRVAIYGIHSMGVGDPDRNDGSGFPAIFVPYEALPPVPTDGNVLISEYRGIAFYRLTTGEYQINAGPDPEGKEYVLIWDGCPSSYIQAYMLQNGVLTQTEVYPRAE